MNVVPSKIIAFVDSAGGHRTASTTLNPNGNNDNEDSDDFNINCITNVLVSFIPVIDNGPGGYGY